MATGGGRIQHAISRLPYTLPIPLFSPHNFEQQLVEYLLQLVQRSRTTECRECRRSLSALRSPRRPGRRSRPHRRRPSTRYPRLPLGRVEPPNRPQEPESSATEQAQADAVDPAVERVINQIVAADIHAPSFP